MLTGHVTSDNEAILPIAVLGTEGRRIEVDAAIDTGYNGFLTLVGMALLGGYRVTMDVEPGGMISIESLANPSSILPRF